MVFINIRALINRAVNKHLIMFELAQEKLQPVMDIFKQMLSRNLALYLPIWITYYFTSILDIMKYE